MKKTDSEKKHDFTKLAPDRACKNDMFRNKIQHWIPSTKNRQKTDPKSPIRRPFNTTNKNRPKKPEKDWPSPDFACFLPP